MATKVAVADGKTTLTIKYAAVSETMNTILAGIAEGLYEVGGPWKPATEGEFADLTMPQKLALIDAYVRWHLLEVNKQRLLRLEQDKYQAGVEAAIVESDVVLE